MPRRSLSQLLVEALALADRLNTIFEKLPPEIRETVIRYSQRKRVKKRRRKISKKTRAKQKTVQSSA
ncbi:MAG: hypothetical protein RMI43_00065 [Candidatus Caldarchaeum sp.]|nr:hypothetical protein [Candidatus Caldarchaeum sp.]MCX8202006.1 hypothetical protein [Candidatus Caldarchaeum sp.]MDW8062550.1 hypothetical protein [Candidatus Caldarchaeum sp.]